MAWSKQGAQRAWMAAGFVLLAGILAWVGPERVGRTVASAEPRYVLLCLMSYAVFFVLRGVRWRLLLREAAPQAHMATTTSLTAFGWLVSTFVPFKAGDVARAAMLSRRARARIGGVAGSVAVERVFDLCGLALAASVGLLGLHMSGHPIPAGLDRIVAVAWALPLLALATLAMVATLLPERATGRLRFLGDAKKAVGANLRSPRRLLAVAGLSILCKVAQVSIFVFAVSAVLPDAPAMLLVAAAPLFLLSFVVSATPGHMGTYEAALVAILALLGVQGDLLPAAVAVHILAMSCVLVLGTTGWLVHRASHWPHPELMPAAQAGNPAASAGAAHVLAPSHAQGLPAAAAGRPEAER